MFLLSIKNSQIIWQEHTKKIWNPESAVSQNLLLQPHTRTPRTAKTKARKEINKIYCGEQQIDGGMTTSDSSHEQMPNFRKRLLSTHSAHSNNLEYDSNDILPHSEKPRDWMNPSDWIIPQSAATELLNLSIDFPSQITVFNRIYLQTR